MEICELSDKEFRLILLKFCELQEHRDRQLNEISGKCLNKMRSSTKKQKPLKHTHTHTHTHTLIQELKNTVTELRNSTEKFNRDSTKQKKESVYLKTGHFKLSSQRSEKEKE